ncbi:hypothetical protein PROFUN_08570 [Planoprotostelium fungivorum]|uniref:Uncharacterized protein n=1 Tax=Planoprotostelium fungivorum TaxID=1890364 RepID=A0A2P6N1P8_9EUKA|nr:hypothetical protein PROFUN_08570 [Planoprotostelium fungivorum]
MHAYAVRVVVGSASGRAERNQTWVNIELKDNLLEPLRQLKSLTLSFATKAEVCEEITGSRPKITRDGICWSSAQTVQKSRHHMEEAKGIVYHTRTCWNKNQGHHVVKKSSDLTVAWLRVLWASYGRGTRPICRSCHLIHLFWCVRVRETNGCIHMHLILYRRSMLGAKASLGDRYRRFLDSGDIEWAPREWNRFIQRLLTLTAASSDATLDSTCYRRVRLNITERRCEVPTQFPCCYLYRGKFSPSGRNDGFLWRPSRGLTRMGRMLRKYSYADYGDVRLCRQVTYLEACQTWQFIEYKSKREHRSNVVFSSIDTADTWLHQLVKMVAEDYLGLSSQLLQESQRGREVEGTDDLERGRISRDDELAWDPFEEDYCGMGM